MAVGKMLFQGLVIVYDAPQCSILVQMLRYMAIPCFVNHGGLLCSEDFSQYTYK